MFNCKFHNWSSFIKECPLCFPTQVITSSSTDAIVNKQPIADPELKKIAKAVKEWCNEDGENKPMKKRVKQAEDTRCLDEIFDKQPKQEGNEIDIDRKRIIGKLMEQKEGNDIANGREYKPSFANLLGEYIGTLKGVVHYDLPNSVRSILYERIAKLESIPIEYTVLKDFPKTESIDKDAIEFAEWILNKEFYADSGDWWDKAFTGQAVRYTTKELYKLYKNNQHG